MNDQIQKLAKELTEKFYFPHGIDPRDISKFVLEREFLARLDEASEHLYDSTMAKERYKELPTNFNSLGVGNEHIYSFIF